MISHDDEFAYYHINPVITKKKKSLMKFNDSFIDHYKIKYDPYKKILPRTPTIIPTPLHLIFLTKIPSYK